MLRKEGKHEENKSGERQHGEIMISIHLRVSRELSVSHTSHSITRNTLLLPNLEKSPAKAFSLVASTHFSWCYQIPLTKTQGETKRKGNMRIKTRKWKEEKWIFCHEIFDFEEQSKQRSQKSVRKLEKEQKGKERHLHNIFHMVFLLKKRKAESGWEMAWCNRCPRPRSMTTGCTWTGLAQLRHDTQQWSRGRSIAHGILNACESWNKFFISFEGDFFLKKIQMIIFEHLFCINKYVPSFQKSSKDFFFFLKTVCSRKSFFFKKRFLFGQIQKKEERHQKKQTEKEKKRKTQTQKNKRTIEK